MSHQTPLEQLTARLSDLAAKRCITKAMKAAKAAAQEAVEATTAYANLQAAIEQYKQAQEDQGTADEALRFVALEIAAELRTKEPAPGIKVIKETTVKITDHEE